MIVRMPNAEIDFSLAISALIPKCSVRSADNHSQFGHFRRMEFFSIFQVCLVELSPPLIF